MTQTKVELSKLNVFPKHTYITYIEVRDFFH